ncbi:hypothetical protein B0H14DRAFT_3529710 [Mycena olivaceomarginata]|nr:hypothetical protein B0H14DRAFT_3529710 [Mycena olivaceomarginata]
MYDSLSASIYKSSRYQGWTIHSETVATASGKSGSKTWLARKIREWSIKFCEDSKNVPTHQYGRWHSSILSDEDLAGDIHMHLQSLGNHQDQDRDQDSQHQDEEARRRRVFSSFTLLWSDDLPVRVDVEKPKREPTAYNIFIATNLPKWNAANPDRKKDGMAAMGKLGLGRLGVRDAHDVVVAVLDRALGRPYEALHLTVAHLTLPQRYEDSLPLRAPLHSDRRATRSTLQERPVCEPGRAAPPSVRHGEPQRLEGSVLGKDDRRDWEAPAPRGRIHRADWLHPQCGVKGNVRTLLPDDSSGSAGA